MFNNFEIILLPLIVRYCLFPISTLILDLMQAAHQTADEIKTLEIIKNAAFNIEKSYNQHF